MAALLCLLGVAVAAAAHVGARLAERRARQVYRELVGEKAALGAPQDAWKETRPLVAGWGCLVTVLEFARGVGVLMALASLLYLIVGR